MMQNWLLKCVLVFLLSFQSAYSQRFSVALEPVALTIGKISLNADYALSKDLDDMLGCDIAVYQNFINLFQSFDGLENFTLFSGFKLSPYYKWNTYSRRVIWNEGIQPTISEYLLFKISGGKFSSTALPFRHDQPDGFKEVYAAQDFFSLGTGFLYGVQIVPVKHFYIDFNAGLQIDIPLGDRIYNDGEFDYKPMYYNNWYAMGPGSIISGRFALGYRF